MTASGEKSKKNYLHFCEYLIPKLWRCVLIDKGVESVLENEIEAYHVITKVPDNHSSLSRFYSLYEPLIFYAASNYIESDEMFKHESKFRAKDLNLSEKFNLSSAIVFKGDYNLAYFDVLEACINSLDPDKKRRLLLIFLDLPVEKQRHLAKLLGISNCICLGSYHHFRKIRYHYCAYLLNTCKSLDSVTFWGIPFGMLFISKLLKKYYKNNSLLVRFLTVKHKFSFNPFYVNQLVNGAPSLLGYDYINQSCENLNPNYYSNYSLKIPPNNHAVIINQESKSCINKLEVKITAIVSLLRYLLEKKIPFFVMPNKVY